MEVIVALDYSDFESAKKSIDLIGDKISFYKVGLELFLSAGEKVIGYLKEKEKHLFLDLKFHDIPNTVAKALTSCLKYSPDIINIHAQGGFEMMKHSANALKEAAKKQGKPSPLLIGVTLLTSLDENHLASNKIGFERSIDYVTFLATECKRAGLDGVVSSAKEVEAIKQACGASFKTVTPGIRLATDSVHDQKRVVTPLDAKKLGADYIVVGRSITGANDPAHAAELILKDC